MVLEVISIQHPIFLIMFLAIAPWALTNSIRNISASKGFSGPHILRDLTNEAMLELWPLSWPMWWGTEVGKKQT